MKYHLFRRTLSGAAVLLACASAASAAPVISRLTPPSLRFATGEPGAPYVARFLPNQRFDLQATVNPDDGKTISNVTFAINGAQVGAVPGTSMIEANATGAVADDVVATLRAMSRTKPGVYTFTATATQNDGSKVTATGEFEIVGLTARGRKAKNVIFMIGDGLGIAHRTAARILYRGVASGKMLEPLEMDAMDATAIVSTHSLNSIITDSAPGAACYSTGNKFNNNQQGVFPDDTRDKFDNPRVELIGEYLARTQGKSLGIVTTSDVFDATPAAFGSHTQDRGAGTGICDQYLDEMTKKANLRVLLGGGRKWFLPATTPGSARATGSDYVLPADLVNGWNLSGAAAGAIDPERDLLGGFQSAGFAYASTKSELMSVGNGATKLLGLFAYSNMNVAKDKLDKRRGVSTVLDDYGFPDQPMLEEMTSVALNVLKKNANGFVLMVEAASIDKQAHNMDTERWLLDTVEFDKAVGVAKDFAAQNPDTLIIVTADHECAGINIIGAATRTLAELQAVSANPDQATAVANLRNSTVGIYEAAGFPVYSLHADGYPAATDVDYKMLIGYAGNADRYEDWLTNPLPLRDSQQPMNGLPPLNTYPNGPTARDVAGNFFITGQVPGSSAVHTGSDIPLTASGRGASLFKGVMDNTDVFFLAMQAAIGGATH